MTTYANIGLAEPSTITKVVAATIVARGSTNEYQEILVIGDPQSSLGLARVVAVPPVSTEFGQVVRIASGPSSAADLAMRAVLSSTSADNPVTISGNSTVVQGTSPWIVGGNSTVVQGTSPWIIGGNSTVVISAGNSSVTITAGNSSVTISAVAGGAGKLNIGSTAADNAVLATPMSTAWVKSAGFSVDSSNVLNVKLDGSTSVMMQGNSTVIQGTNPWVVSPNSTAFVKSMGLSVDSSNALNVKLDGSTAITIGAGNSSVTIAAVATGARMNIGSTAADNAVLSTPMSTAWVKSAGFSVDSSNSLNTKSLTLDALGNAIESSTHAAGPPNSTMRGLAVRSLIPALLTTASTNLFASTTFTIATSNATTVPYVYAYSIMTTNQTPTVIGFYAGSTLVAPLKLASISSAISGVNLAVSPPAYLFAGSTGAILQLKTKGSTGLGYVGWVSYWTD